LPGQEEAGPQVDPEHRGTVDRNVERREQQRGSADRDRRTEPHEPTVDEPPEEELFGDRAERVEQEDLRPVRDGEARADEPCGKDDRGNPRGSDHDGPERSPNSAWRPGWTAPSVALVEKFIDSI